MGIIEVGMTNGVQITIPGNVGGTQKKIKLAKLLWLGPGAWFVLFQEEYVNLLRTNGQRLILILENGYLSGGREGTGPQGTSE